MMNLQIIPQKIAKSLRNKLEAYVSLIGLSGSTWKIKWLQLMIRYSSKFVDTYYLEENDLIVLKYIGASRFDIFVFSSKSLWWKKKFVLHKKMWVRWCWKWKQDEEDYSRKQTYNYWCVRGLKCSRKWQCKLFVLIFELL